MTDSHLDRYRNWIDEGLLNGIHPDESLLEEALHYALSVPGKRLRPMLFLSMVEAFDMDPEPYMAIALGIECIHTYSLIHDDLPAMDNDDLRRGMPTVHKKYNEAVALLAGDTLLTYAFELIAGCGAAPHTLVEIIRVLTRRIGIKGMAGGQSLDLQFRGELDQVFDIHRMKTADLIRGTLVSAGLVIGLNRHRLGILDQVGLIIGIAFQMADDLLDVEGSEAEVGKRLQKDLGNLSPNSVIHYGREEIVSRIDDSYKRVLELLAEIPVNYPPFLDLMKRMVYRSR